MWIFRKPLGRETHEKIISGDKDMFHSFRILRYGVKSIQTLVNFGD